MKLNQLTFAIGVLAISQSVSALDFDLRHEYRPGSAYSDGKSQQQSRFKVGENFKFNDDWRANLSLETKFKGDDPREFMEKLYIHEMELDMGLTYKLGGNWELKPGMPINFAFRNPSSTNTANGDEAGHFYLRKITYKPQIRLQHRLNFSDVRWTNALRYRHEFADFVRNGDGDTVRDKNGNSVGVKSNPQQIKMTLTGNLRFEADKNIYFAWEANYTKSLDDVRKGVSVDSKMYDYDWDAGVMMGYRFGNWRPYVEAWTIKGPDADNMRSAKYRIGLKYWWK